MESGEDIKNIRLLAEGGDADAQFKYVCCLIKYAGIEEDKEVSNAFVRDALRYLKMSADHGNTSAQIEYGNLLYKGFYVEKDLVEAAKYYKMAADRGDALGQNNYGTCLRYGAGVDKNQEEAFKYFKLSAELGEVSAQTNYAVSLYYGEGTEKNIAEATAVFKKAADRGCPYSQFNYGCCLVNGEGVERNLLEASRYFGKVSCNEKDPELYNLAVTLHFKCLMWAVESGERLNLNMNIRRERGEYLSELEMIERAVANLPRSLSDGRLSKRGF
jgi:hypothetical protein